MFINTSKVIIPYQSNYGNIIKSKGADQAKMLYCADFIKNKAPPYSGAFLCLMRVFPQSYLYRADSICLSEQ